jgi:hypothetical protein
MGFGLRDLALDRDLDRDFDRARLPATKAREVAFGLELPADRGREAPVAAPELLRDRGGEDARVAMLWRLRDCTHRAAGHTPSVAAIPITAQTRSRGLGLPRQGRP